MLAYLIGALGGGLVVLATVVPSFPLLLRGMAAFGAGSSADLQARFAAADLVAGRSGGAGRISDRHLGHHHGSVAGPATSRPRRAGCSAVRRCR
ncbi:Putative MFS-type transporter YddS OS=Streptomyces microflavus OX=1919 GN=yddS PE=4 SV=1 [Streptomyces microflavus]